VRTHRGKLGCLVSVGALFAGAHVGFSNEPSAKELVSYAANAIASAKSVRLSGVVVTGKSSESIDLEIFSNNDVSGTLTIGKTLLKVAVFGKTAYFQAPAGYWQSVGHLPATIAKEISPDWISMPNSGPDGFGTSFELGPLASSLRSSVGPSIVGSKKVDGQQATEVKFADGSLFWIANSSPHRPIETLQSSKGGGMLVFSGWNSFRVPPPPKHAVPLSSFG
jgi:hypothetical protein